jgi:hypothetical protein
MRQRLIEAAGWPQWGEQYRRTFAGTLLLALLMSALVFRASHHEWRPTAVVFAFMHACGLLGAMWVSRLKRLLQSRSQ